MEGVPEHHLKRRLAAAVRSIRWSYAIFWVISTRKQGMLVWGDGYYNGDIKTTKTVQSIELNDMDLQRSKQLRELYKFLSAGNTIQQEKWSAALSPEDLTDIEWYYLVCMSFTFKHGQGMPGRALANGHHIWLCNANYADSKLFTRSLLAKTVICFPLMGGVLEIGVTELISEDPSLLQHIRTFISELPRPVCSEQSNSSPRKADNNEDCACTVFDHGIVNGMPLDKVNSTAHSMMLSEVGGRASPMPVNSYSPKENIPSNINDELKRESSGDSSNGFNQNHDIEDSFLVDDLNSTSQIHYINDEFSDGLHGSVNSSNCTSESVLNPERVVISPSSQEKASKLPLQDLQECNHPKLSLLDLETQDSHYAKILAAVFQNSQRSAAKPYFQNDSCHSNFMAWREGWDTWELQIITKQKMLKKVLFDSPWMHGRYLPNQGAVASKERVWKTEESGIGVNYALPERRDKVNEKFLILRSMVPIISKVDKASILSETIEYLKDLEKRVEELETCRESAESGARERRKHPDIVERTSDNYGNNETADGSKPSIHKRKASDINETDAELSWLLSKDIISDMTVTVVGKEVLIELRCPWRECLLLEIVEALSSLNLDALLLNSSTTDGFLTLTLTSKFRGVAAASVGMIKHTLQSIVRK
ncbi:hypothetical protein AAC387_Pa11g0283 [Persea americana]